LQRACKSAGFEVLAVRRSVNSPSVERTIGKHLPRCNGKLEATNGSHAAVIAWGLGPTS